MQSTELHQPTVSGLWSHSHDADADLMKKFVVESRQTPALGWTAVSSFERESAAEQDKNDRVIRFAASNGRHVKYPEFRIRNQFTE